MSEVGKVLVVASGNSPLLLDLQQPPNVAKTIRSQQRPDKRSRFNLSRAEVESGEVEEGRSLEGEET